MLVLQQEKKVQKREHEFVGYLRSEDFRSLGGAQNFYPYDPIVPETVGEVLSHEKVSVKDEFSIVKSKAPMNRVAIELRRPTTQFVLVQSKKKRDHGYCHSSEFIDTLLQQKDESNSNTC